MNKKLFIVPLSFVLLTCSSQAFFGFGFSYGDFVRQPAPMPLAHVGFGVPLSDEGPSIGLGFSIPLGDSSANLDDEGKPYWRIFNDTNRDIRVSNSQGDTKVIRPGESRKLSHARSFKLKIRAPGLERDIKTRSHRVSVRLNTYETIAVESV